MTNFSPNMLKSFNECPKKYHLKYIQHILAPQKTTPFEKGKKIHALANYYLRKDDITKLEKVLTADEALTFEKLKNNEYFQKTALHSEYNLSCKINSYWIGGRLDALMQEANQYYILDYKTGSIPKSPEFDYQTMVYLLAAKKFLKCENLSFVYIDLKNDLNHKIDLTFEREIEYTNELIKICKKIESTKDFHKNETGCKYCEYKKLCNN